jgi:LacI family transcriptional regulator
MTEPGVARFLTVDRSSPVSIEAQLSRQITMLIASGHVSPGDRLPSIRALADHLGINQLTVRAAYRRLGDQGLVDLRRGRGTTVISEGLAELGADRRDQRSFTIGVILPGFVPFYAPLMRGIHSANPGDPSQFLIVDVGNDPATAVTYLRQLVARDVDGVIMVSQFLEEPPGSEGLPPMVFGDWPSSPRPAVVFDLGALREAVGHLVDEGHQRIAFVSPLAGDAGTNVAAMAEAFRSAATEHGLPAEAAMLIETPGWGVADGERAIESMMSSDDTPTAVITAAEDLGIGLIQGLRARSMAVPGDVALIVVGPTDAAPLFDPPLSTVDLPAFEMGRILATSLHQMIAGDPVDQPRVVLPSSLTIRGSCGPH